MGESERNFIDNPHLEGTREEYIANQMKLAYKVAHKMLAYALNRGLEYDDLMSIAMMGLIKAYDGYDPTKFDGQVTKFSTYAVPKIQGEIQRYIRDGHDSGIKISRLVKELSSKIVNSEKTYSSAEEVMEDFEVSKTYAQEALDYLSGKTKVQSINETIFSSDQEDITLEETMGKEQDLSNIHLKEFIESLNEREQKIVDLLFVKDMTQAEVGKIIGVSQVQISRIIHRIRERAEAFQEFGYTHRSLEPQAEFKAMKKEKIKMKKVKKVEASKDTTKRKRKPPVPKSREEAIAKMVSTEMLEVKRLLEETDLPYTEIAKLTGVSGATVRYYGLSIRTPEHVNRVKRETLAKNREKKLINEGETKVEEKKIEGELVVRGEVVTATVAPQVETPSNKGVTRVDITAGGDGLTISEIQDEFARTIQMLHASRASSVSKFKMELKVEA